MVLTGNSYTPISLIAVAEEQRIRGIQFDQARLEEERRVDRACVERSKQALREWRACFLIRSAEFSLLPK